MRLELVLLSLFRFFLVFWLAVLALEADASRGGGSAPEVVDFAAKARETASFSLPFVTDLLPILLFLTSAPSRSAWLVFSLAFASDMSAHLLPWASIPVPPLPLLGLPSPPPVLLDLPPFL